MEYTVRQKEKNMKKAFLGVKRCFKDFTTHAILSICVPLVVILALGCSAPNVSVTDDSRKPVQGAVISNKIQQAETQIGKTEESQARSRQEYFRTRFITRMGMDHKTYSPEERHEIERLYQAASKQWNSSEARESLKTLIAKFPKANRTGCAVLYLGQMAEGRERETYLRRAIDEFGDCWYGDGVQVGAYARFYLALYYRQTTGNAGEAEKLYEALRKEYPDAIDHKGILLIDKLLAMNKQIEAPAHTLSKSMPSNGPVIRGTLRDGTQDYSEKQFSDFERVMARANVEKGSHKVLEEALMQLIRPGVPMPNVTVTLSTKPGTPAVRKLLLKTRTDSQGNFGFPDVPQGEYVVTAEIRRGWLAEKTEVQRLVEHYRSCETVDLVYYPNPVIVKGKITDTSGRPLASVKVTAVQCNHDIEGDYTVNSHVVSAVSDRDGSYELQGLIPADAWEAAPLVMGGTGYAHNKYNIHTELEGHVPAEVKIPIVPEEVRTAALRLMRILLEQEGPEGKARLAAIKPAALPACQGNTITGIDFVLASSSLIAGNVIDSQIKPQSKDELVPEQSQTVTLQNGQTSSVQLRF